MIHLFLILVVKGIEESVHFDLTLLIFSFFSNPAIVTFFFKISDENLKFLRVEIYSVFVFSCILFLALNADAVTMVKNCNERLK